MANIHEELIRAACSKLENEGGKVLEVAHIEMRGLPSPHKIGGFIPDAYGISAAGRPIIIEAESTEGLKLLHTADQLESFIKEGEVWLAVKADDLSEATFLAHSVDPSIRKIKVVPISAGDILKAFLNPPGRR